jgi:hypothetical protein
VAAGDTLVVLATAGGTSRTFTAPSGGGLTFTLQASALPSSGTSFGNVYVWTASAASAQTFALSFNPVGGTSDSWSGQVLRFSGVTSVGASSSGHAPGAPSLSLTTTSANSTVVFGSTDYYALDGSTRRWVTSSGPATEDGYDMLSGYQTDYFGHYGSLGSAGAKTVGISSPTGQHWSAVALELVGSAGSSQSGTLALSASASLVASGSQGSHGWLYLGASTALAVSGSGTVGGLLKLSASASLALTGNGTNRTPPPIIRPVAPLDMYRSGFALWYTVDASYNGAPLAGATGMTPTGGSIIDTIKPGVRRALTLDLAPMPGLYELLKPTGVTLTVTAHVRGTSRVVTDIPMGVFDIDSGSVQDGGGAISLTAPDLWVRIQRAKFVAPTSSVPGLTIPQQIARLITGALGAVPVTITATCTTPMKAMIFDRDREKAIVDLATSGACWVYFDRHGNAVIADVPTIDRSPAWLADASPSGVLVSLSRQSSRTTTHNVVVVDSTASAGAAYPTQVVFDSDPASATYAGTDPVNNPGSAGPFGISPYFLDESLLTNAADARRAGLAILSKTVGVASQISLTQLPNPNIDAFDSIQVLPPKQRSDIPQVTEQHVADTVTHPLDVTQPMQIAGRSTRTDSYS